jgi:phosphoglycolate phosphatase
MQLDLPRLVIFDLDGTLLDTMGDIHAALCAALVAHGYLPVDRSRMHSLVGDGAAMLVALAVNLPRESPLVAQVLETYLQIYEQTPVVHTIAMPGALLLLDALQALKIAIFVCTNKPRRVAQNVVHRVLGERVTGLVAGGDCAKLKPHPDPLNKCMELAGVSARHTWMVGDGPQDVQAARNAGVISIGYVSNFADPVRMKALQPDVTVTHFDQIRALIQPPHS